MDTERRDIYGQRLLEHFAFRTPAHQLGNIHMGTEFLAEHRQQHLQHGVGALLRCHQRRVESRHPLRQLLGAAQVDALLQLLHSGQQFLHRRVHRTACVIPVQRADTAEGSQLLHTADQVKHLYQRRGIDNPGFFPVAVNRLCHPNAPIGQYTANERQIQHGVTEAPGDVQQHRIAGLQAGRDRGQYQLLKVGCTIIEQLCALTAIAVGLQQRYQPLKGRRAFRRGHTQKLLRIRMVAQQIPKGCIIGQCSLDRSAVRCREVLHLRQGRPGAAEKYKNLFGHKPS